MDRRTFLAGAAALAGCTGGGNSATPTPAGPPRLVERSFDQRDGRCGAERRDVATATFDPEGPRIRVDGRASTAAPCHVLGLAGVAVDGSRLTVDVVRARSGVGCDRCPATIPYELSAWFEDRLPSAVVVRHGGRRVTVATR